MAERGPGSFLFAAIFSLTCLTSLTFRNRRLPGTLRDPVQITFATTLIRGGTDLVAVADMLGHARLDTVRLCTHPSAAARERALNLLPYDR